MQPGDQPQHSGCVPFSGFQGSSDFSACSPPPRERARNRRRPRSFSTPLGLGSLPAGAGGIGEGPWKRAELLGAAGVSAAVLQFSADQGVAVERRVGRGGGGPRGVSPAAFGCPGSFVPALFVAPA